MTTLRYLATIDGSSLAGSYVDRAHLIALESLEAARTVAADLEATGRTYCSHMVDGTRDRLDYGIALEGLTMRLWAIAPTDDATAAADALEANTDPYPDRIVTVSDRGAVRVVLA